MTDLDTAADRQRKELNELQAELDEIRRDVAAEKEGNAVDDDEEDIFRTPSNQEAAAVTSTKVYFFILKKILFISFILFIPYRTGPSQ